MGFDSPILNSEIRVTRAFRFTASPRLRHSYDNDENLLGVYNPTIMNDKFTNVDNFELYINDDCIARFTIDSPINRSFFAKKMGKDLYENARLQINWTDIFDAYINDWDSLFIDKSVRNTLSDIFDYINNFVEYIYYMCFDVPFYDYDTDIQWHLFMRWNKKTKSYEIPVTDIYASDYYFNNFTTALQSSYCFPNLEEFSIKDCKRIVYITENDEQIYPHIEVVIN